MDLEQNLKLCLCIRMYYYYDFLKPASFSTATRHMYVHYFLIFIEENMVFTIYIWYLLGAFNHYSKQGQNIVHKNVS